MQISKVRLYLGAGSLLPIRPSLMSFCHGTDFTFPHPWKLTDALTLVPNSDARILPCRPCQKGSLISGVISTGLEGNGDSHMTYLVFLPHMNLQGRSGGVSRIQNMVVSIILGASELSFVQEGR